MDSQNIWDSRSQSAHSTWGGGDNSGDARIRIVRPSGVTDAGRIVRPSGVAEDCGALVSHYQTLHGHFMAEKDPQKKLMIDGQMRGILNHMHSMGCGQRAEGVTTHKPNNAGQSSFTGSMCGMGADGLTNPMNMDSGGGMNDTFAAPNASTCVFQGRTTKVWGNASDALCGVSTVDMVVVNNGAWGTEVPVVPIMNHIPSCTSTVCTPSAVCDTPNTNSMTQGSTVALPSVPATPMPAYVKPTFWQWIMNGMKA